MQHPVVEIVVVAVAGAELARLERVTVSLFMTDSSHSQSLLLRLLGQSLLACCVVHVGVLHARLVHAWLSVFRHFSVTFS